MREQYNIAPLSPRELNAHHFGEEWTMNVHEGHDLFHINRLEDVVHKIKFPLPPHRKTVYDFFFLTQGTSTRSKGLYKSEFGARTFFFLPAYQISTHEYVSPDAKGFFCHFAPEIFNGLAAFQEMFGFWHFWGNPTIQIDERLHQPVINILERLLTEYETHKTLNTNLIATYLLALFIELSIFQENLIDKNPQNASLRITEKYKNLLSVHIYKTSKVNDYASMLAITPDHLNKCVKATIGKTAQELLAEMMILEAKVLLKQTELSISEIAFKFSETNPSDFTRFFKSKTGVSPKEYRKSIV